MIQHTRTFTANDEQGNEYQIEEYTELLDVRTMGNVHARVHGMKTLKTQNGQHINNLGQGKYEIVASGIILHSAASDMP